MAQPNRAAGKISNAETYREFARRVYETGIISDAWYDGVERFALDGVVLSQRQARDLYTAAERVAYLHQELAQILADDEKLLEGFYHLTDAQKLMWQSSGGLWHGMARADLFICEEGSIQCCELNSDTPSGQPEAVILNELLFEKHCAMHGALSDPNRSLRENFLRILRESHQARTNTELKRVGIVYPTELTEDLAMITMFARWLKDDGIETFVGSPYNLRRANGALEMLGNRVDLIFRHYKTDWWGERETVWRNSPEYWDTEPLYHALGILLEAEMHGEVTVVNPFGAVVTQNKFSLAFFWEEQKRFSFEAQEWIRLYIPETVRLENFALDQLRRERESWVLKSDYGCESRETVCGAFVTDEAWTKAIDEAKPERFVVQRFFRVKADSVNRLPNFGVYIFGGTAGGIFTRVGEKGTELSSVTVPTFISENS